MTKARNLSVAGQSYLVLGGLIALGVLAQVFLAGIAVFVDDSYWAAHVTFAHVFEALLLLWLIAGVLSELPRRLQLAPVGVFILLIIQYATASMAGSFVAAFHPVNAIVIFVVVSAASWSAWN